LLPGSGAALAAGSCLALGDGTTVSPALNEAIAACNQNSASSCHLRTRSRSAPSSTA
jgi:hypothetical protein